MPDAEDEEDDEEDGAMDVVDAAEAIADGGDVVISTLPLRCSRIVVCSCCCGGGNCPPYCCNRPRDDRVADAGVAAAGANAAMVVDVWRCVVEIVAF